MKKGLAVLAGMAVTGVVSALTVRRVMKNATIIEEYHEYFDDELDEELRSIEKKVEEEVKNEDKKEILDMSKEIEDISNELRNIYPIEGSYGSACSLWQIALKDGIVTESRFSDASEYYGNRWHYTGD